MIFVVLSLIVSLIVFFFLLLEGIANKFKGDASAFVGSIIAIIGCIIWMLILK